MKILITAKGQYTVLDKGNCCSAPFDNLRDAIARVRNAGCVPIFTWDAE